MRLSSILLLASTTAIRIDDCVHSSIVHSFQPGCPEPSEESKEAKILKKIEKSAQKAVSKKLDAQIEKMNDSAEQQESTADAHK